MVAIPIPSRRRSEGRRRATIVGLAVALVFVMPVGLGIGEMIHEAATRTHLVRQPDVTAAPATETFIVTFEP